MRIGTLIFGGGAAGLWLLDELTRRGHSALLLEAGRLGGAQTVASQGILHGGLKYTLQGLLTKSAAHIRDMPALWRECLAGIRAPNLTATTVRAEHCYLWRTETVASRLGMIGAKIGLRVSPKSVPDEERPAVLRECPGTVARLNEQVISPATLIADLSDRNRERILKIDVPSGIRFECESAGCVQEVQLANPKTGVQLAVQPETVVFTAGAGNAVLREQVGLDAAAMQRRPLHMVLARGQLPLLNGHCVDGRKTRVTITSDRDEAGRIVWQIGGQLAEDGVALDPTELIRRAAIELRTTIPGIDLAGIEWTTYRVNRAEASHGRRPETFSVRSEGNVITAWPTKLVLVPKLAETIAGMIAPDPSCPIGDSGLLTDWPRPQVARPPWETCTDWIRLEDDSTAARSAA